MIIDKDNFLLNLISDVQQWHTKSALTLISDFFLSSEFATTRQTDSIAYELKLRSFYKSAHLWVYLADFHLQCELCPTTVFDSIIRLSSLLLFLLQFCFTFLVAFNSNGYHIPSDFIWHPYLFTLF